MNTFISFFSGLRYAATQRPDMVEFPTQNSTMTAASQPVRLAGRFWKGLTAFIAALLILFAGELNAQQIISTARTTSNNTLPSGTYELRNNVTQGTSSSPIPLIISGNVTIILADDCVWTINGGVRVSSGHTLTIEGAGTLTANGAAASGVTGGSAGIGGGAGSTAGTITINSGTVIASGGDAASGSSGGSGGTSNGGGGAGAGIGGGGGSASNGGSNSTQGGRGGGGTEITINGGRVMAIGGKFGNGGGNSAGSGGGGGAGASIGGGGGGGGGGIAHICFASCDFGRTGISVSVSIGDGANGGQGGTNLTGNWGSPGGFGGSRGTVTNNGTVTESSSDGRRTVHIVVPATVPGSPQNVLATPGNGQITLNWNAPSSNGGSAITRYEVQRDNGSWISTGLNYSYIFQGLTNGTSYTVRVRAVNSVGNGASVERTITMPPGQVTASSPADGATNQSIRPTFTWQQPTGTITGYDVYMGTSANPSNFSSNRVATVTGASNRSWTHTWDLSYGTTYHWQIVAYNQTGNGTASASRNFTTVAFVPVTKITEVPEVAMAGTPLTLTGTIEPSNATNKSITWSVVSAGGTGANIPSGNILNTNAEGTATIRATIVNGRTMGTNYTEDFSVTVNIVPVTNIIDVPTTAIAGVPLSLTGTIVPNNASFKTIAWSVENAGTTGASITGSVFNATAGGTATVKATIANGKAIGTPYEQTFSVTVNIVPVTNITGVPATATADVPLTLTGTVNPNNATFKTIAWSMRNAGTTGATITDNTFRAIAGGTATVVATIANGSAMGTPYTQECSISVFEPVTNISGVPSEAIIGIPLSLTGTVVRSTATNQNIVWSVVNAGTTGATITGNTFNATSCGTATVRATIANGLGIGINYVQNFSIAVKNIPVTNIIIPTSVTIGVPRTLSGTVEPRNATFQTIVWSVQSPGTTGAYIDGNTLYVVSHGTALITATIKNGSATCADYTQPIFITATDVFTSVTNITEVPTTANIGMPLTLTGTVVPNNASGQSIAWSVVNAGTTGATITGGNTLNTTAAGTVTVRATIANGTAIGTNYVKDFTISVIARTITVGAQNGTLTEGVAGTVTFPVTTTNIANGQTGTITWYSNAEGTTLTSATGITAQMSNVASNAATVTVNATAAVTTGTRYFRVSIDGVLPSNVATLTVLAPPVTFTAVQTGGASGTANSTGIVLTFNKEVTGLTDGDITITNGTGQVTKGALSGSSTTWTIGLTSVAMHGNVTVSVRDFGNFRVTTTSQSVAVFKELIPITFTAEQTGGSSGTANSTGIILTFSQAVTGLNPNNITITNGTGQATKGTSFNGSGTTYTIGLTNVATEGNVSVSVSDFGTFRVTNNPQTVEVYRARTPVTFTAVQLGGTSGTANSTDIRLTFSQAVTGLTANNITIENGTGQATKGTTLTGSGTIWNINLASVTTQGNVSVSVSGFGTFRVTNNPQTVAVFMDTRPTISFTAEQTGGTSGTANSTGIRLTFSQAITGLTAGNITIASGTGAATKGTTLTGSGTTWTIGLTNVAVQGNVIVCVHDLVNFLVTPSCQTVSVYTRTPVTFTAVQLNGVSGTANSTGIVLTFSQAVSGLVANDITIANGAGQVTKGTLTGSGTTYIIGLTNVATQGNVSVSVSDFGTFRVTNNPQTVAVYRVLTPVTFTAVQVGGASGTANSTDIRLTFNQSVTGLTNANVIINNGTGVVTKGALSSGSGTTLMIGLSSVVTQGNVTVTVNDFGTFRVTNNPQTVEVFKANLMIAVTSTGLTNLKVDQEVNNASILYTLSNGTYATYISPSNFAVDNLPEGLKAGTATRTSNTVVTVAITGTPTTHNASTRNVALTMSIPASNVTGATSAIVPIGTVTASAVAKGDGALVSAPMLASKTANNITVHALPAPANGQTIEYARNTAYAAPSSGWQTELAFTGLNAKTSYWIFARTAENANYLAGTASNPLLATTDKITSSEISDAPLARLYPNPTDGVFTLEFEAEGVYNLTLADMSGKILLRQTVKGQSVQMDLSNYPAGAYLLTIDDGERKSVTKVVKN